MTPQQRNMAILAVLILIIPIVAYLRWPKTAGAPAGAPVSGTAIVEGGGTAEPIQSVFDEGDIDIDELVQNIKEVEFKYSETRLARDPMAPLVGRATSTFSVSNEGDSGGTPAFRDENLIYEANRKDVTGILWDENNPLAVVDDAIVRVGYQFEEGLSVKEIGLDYIKFSLKLENEELEVTRELKEQ